MGISRVSALREIFEPYFKTLAVGAAVPAGLALYDVCCNQFGWPKLPNLWNMTLAKIPWWGWLLFAQAVFVYALFEYVRRLAPAKAPNDEVAALDMGDAESRLRANQGNIDRLIAEVEANRLELAGLVESSELIAARWGEQKKKAEMLAAYLRLLNGKQALLQSGERALDCLKSDPTAPGYERMNHIRSFAMALHVWSLPAQRIFFGLAPEETHHLINLTASEMEEWVSHWLHNTEERMKEIPEKLILEFQEPTHEQ